MNWNEIESKCIEKMRLRRLAYKTEVSYLGWIRRYCLWLKKENPAGDSTSKFESYLTHLALKEKVAASTQNQAFNAILFFYRRVLSVDLGHVKALRAKQESYVREAPSVEDTRRLLNEIGDANGYPVKLICKMLYGCELRVSEPLNLRIKDIRLSEGKMVIRQSKGGKYRVVGIPQSLKESIAAQMRAARGKWEQDHASGLRVTLPNAYERKDPRAAVSWEWYWLFPQHAPCNHPQTGEAVRFRMHEANVQREVRRAKNKAGIVGRITPHNFRHAYATHCLDSGANIHDMKEVLGHKNIETTMIYLHPQVDRVKSPLENLAI